MYVDCIFSGAVWHMYLPNCWNELNDFVAHWNSLKMRINKLGNCPSGIPDDLYEVPSQAGELIITVHINMLAIGMIITI